jgi:GNAT superfamily N-acetyltransferase
MSDIEVSVAAYDAPTVAEMIAELQAEYVVRYGSGDDTPVRASEFAPPNGIFVIGSDDETPVACGGIRLTAPGVAELKRMYVRAPARRRGIARFLLARLEDEARALGASRVQLETGRRQPEAIAMYEAAGYEPTDPFGHYADAPESVHLAKDLRSRPQTAGGAGPIVPIAE